MAVEEIDFLRLLRKGDGIVVGQACSEAVTLTQRLAQQAPEIANALGRVNVFVAGSYSGVFRPELGAHFAFSSYGALGDGAALARAGCLDVIPTHYSQLPWLFHGGRVRSDVLLLQLSPADASGRHSMGLANDFQLAAARSARVIVAEVNAQVPWTYGAELPADLRIDHWVHSDRDIVEVPAGSPGVTAARIAERVAALIPDGATLQMGIGSIMHAICRKLRSHRDLGVHTGIITDGIADLMECGAINNSRKPQYTGVTVTGSLLGTRRLFKFAHMNRSIRLVETQITHGARVLADLYRLCAINSALEVDLTGQVNAEVSSGAYVGAVGGQIDFLRAAAVSEGGRSFIALPSTAAGGKTSRIVVSLNGVATTTPRSDVDCVVTEWGVAQLRGLNLRQRMSAMAGIAHPDFRERLLQAAGRKGKV